MGYYGKCLDLLRAGELAGDLWTAVDSSPAPSCTALAGIFTWKKIWQSRTGAAGGDGAAMEGVTEGGA